MAIQFWIQGRKIIQIVIPEKQSYDNDPSVWGQIYMSQWAIEEIIIGFSFCIFMTNKVERVELLRHEKALKKMALQADINIYIQLGQYINLSIPYPSSPYCLHATVFSVKHSSICVYCLVNKCMCILHVALNQKSIIGLLNIKFSCF